ncbi:hypothetical protein [Variovorax paradoxus]|jgi:hypothetical protein|uniref:hypothetical protein n=1 Tax=Variovorax paradoxus TaxID=34073 RepID=UPI0012375E24
MTNSPFFESDTHDWGLGLPLGAAQATRKMGRAKNIHFNFIYNLSSGMSPRLHTDNVTDQILKHCR